MKERTMIKLNLDKKLNYLLACSYGPDSMSLFCLLKSQGYSFDCAIVNYHLRKESDEEVKNLIKYADKNHVKVHTLDAKNVPTKNIESKCREIRYQYFKELSDAYGFEGVLVAHHQDDLIETFLLQKQRQNCPIYFGIAENTVINGVNIIRPLLAYSKSELLEICKVNNVPYSVDKTNFDTAIKRNKIRHEIVSKMTQDDRDEIINEINDKNHQLETMFKDFEMLDLTNVQVILSMDSLKQRYALNKLLSNCGILTNLSKENVGQVVSNLKSKKPNIFVKIKKGVFLVKEYDKFYFSNTIKQSCSYSYTLVAPSKLDTPYFYLDFSKDSSNRNVSLSDYPITVRNVRPSDIYKINEYEVKARRLLIDWKVPQSLRESWTVIINKDNKVIYIPRYRKTFKPDSNCNFYVKTK